jgi:hypothetical protein
MVKPDSFKVPTDTRPFIVLNPRPPFVDILLRIVDINFEEFSRLNHLALSWENDPRLIEMVRLGGDGSAKVPYLIDQGETAESILEQLRAIIRPHLEHLAALPEPIQSTIQLLLSLNTLPKGCDIYAIAALLEIDRIHADMIHTLHERMVGRTLAKQFYQDNCSALADLDEHWNKLRKEIKYPVPDMILPKHSQVEYEPVFEKKRLRHVYETCVIVPPPDRELLLRYTAPELRRPLPPDMPVPPTGSVDWLLREVGKVGRHFTRAILHMVQERLAEEQISPDAKNYREITEQAMLIWQDHVEKLP